MAISNCLGYSRDAATSSRLFHPVILWSWQDVVVKIRELTNYLSVSFHVSSLDNETESSTITAPNWAGPKNETTTNHFIGLLMYCDYYKEYKSVCWLRDIFTGVLLNASPSMEVKIHVTEDGQKKKTRIFCHPGQERTWMRLWVNPKVNNNTYCPMSAITTMLALVTVKWCHCCVSVYLNFSFFYSKMPFVCVCVCVRVCVCVFPNNISCKLFC